ncbi:MAG: adenylate/guanylate cyclase domain-containing protein [Acidimicrobiia bacterium]
MASRPTGTVSFLFTDVAGSTRLWDSDREGMAASLAVHDRILTEALAAHGGYVFSTAGDSFGAAFPTARAALTAAVAAQLALGSEAWTGPPIRVRMGIHTGSSQERDGNYFGPDVNRAARVMSAANGGQVLVSGATAELAGALETPLALVDRGIHALKDLERPEHLFELRHPDLPEVAEDLHTLDVERVHLPSQLTTFVGRQVELEAVTRMIRGSRLVTLTGAGGTGKTRLAVEAASTLSDEYPDGVWMVELDPISDGDLVASEVANLWGLRPGEGIELVQVIVGHLAGRRLLLIVDNCEHVLASAARVIDTLLAAGPGLSVVATSRESLGIPGETVYRVPSLGLPADGAADVDSDAVRLFLDRAGRVRPGFSATPTDLAAIARICRRLDGIPLGIELAAARMRTLGPLQLADRIDDSFRILAGGAKAGVARQRTLETAIDWSHDLLDDRESSLFRRLSVFAGGFDLVAAEVVGASEGVEDWEVLDLLDQLVDKSLVVVGPAGGDTRFRLLEPIRRYGEERLLEAGELSEVRSAHARHYARLAAATAPRLRGRDQDIAVAGLMLELDNLRGALATLVDQRDADLFLDTCFHLLWFWALASLQVEGREVVLSGLEEVGAVASPSSVARAWFAVSMLAVFLTDPRAVEYAERGMDVARRADDALAGWVSLQRGMAEANVGSGDDPRPWLEEGERLIRLHPEIAMWDPEWDGLFVDFMLEFGGLGTPEERAARTRKLIAGATALGDRYMAANAMVSAYFLPGDVDEDWVIGRLREAATMLRDLDSRHGLGHALFYLGNRTRQSGRGKGLEELAEASLLLGEVGDVPCSTWSGVRLVEGLIDDGSFEDAARELAVIARRLLAFDREVESGVVVQACRLAAGRGEWPTAARLLGRLESGGAGGEEGVATLRQEIAGALPEDELAGLSADGGAMSARQTLAEIATAFAR